MSVFNPSPAFKYPTAVTSAFGRFFYAVGSTLYYSQSLVSAKVAGKCYQSNDPTSEEAPDILATDGGVLPVEGAVNIRALRAFRAGVLMFAENGVWYIFNNEGGFKATAFNLTKVTDQGIASPRSVVLAEGSAMYFSSNGIVQISTNEFEQVVGSDITEQSIRTFYLENYLESDSRGAYDSTNKSVVWCNAGSPSKLLVYDLRTKAFYPQRSDSSRQVNAGIKVNSSFKYFTSEDDGTTYTYSLSEPTSTSFEDFGTDVPAYLVTGFETLGKFSHKKAITQCATFFQKTETEITGYEGGKYTYDLPSSCLLQARWDFDNSNVFKKWVGIAGDGSGSGRQIQLYNPVQRGFVATEFPYDFDTGESIITKRSNIRGNGKAVQLKFEAEPNKDLRLLGYSVKYSMRGNY